MLEAIAALPIFIQQVAVTQIGDAGAANLAEAGQRGSVRARLQDEVYPVPYALQRHSMVRRAEEDESVQPLRPPVARRRAVVAGTTGNQAAQAVAHDGKLFQ